MNVSRRWLLDLVPGLDLGAEALAEHLAKRGAPVESMATPGAGLGDIVVARVVTAARHPNADRLSVCTVDGGGGIAHVVCGAPNVRAGAWYPFAPVGASLPGDVRIKKSKIRGEVSEGMLCSAKELGLGADHAGILEIHGDFTPGQPFVEALGLGDTTLDVEVTSNRGDLLSHVGLAREVASLGPGRVALPDVPGDTAPVVSYVEAAPRVQAGPVVIQIDDAQLCPRYLAAVVRGVAVGPSPAWLQARLRGAGARPINNVVDATNYVMLELGQPLHAFDLARLAGSTIVVRRARSDEGAFITLDGVERRLPPDALMICDAQRPVAIAGVMGGLHSEVEPTTTDLLLECALFDRKSVRATRKALAMSTDASYRFERGVDPQGLRGALERCVSVILATAGGRLDGPVLDCAPIAFEPSVVGLRLARVERLLGIPFEAAYVRRLLTPLGFEIVDEREGTLRVRVPGFRSYDVTREVDLIEEIARTHGFDNFPAELRPFRPGTVADHPLFVLEDELRGHLAARGLFEAHTPAFAPPGEGDVEVANPLAASEPFLRDALLPALLRRVEHNLARGNRDVRLFEIGTAFRRAGPGLPPHEATHLAAALTGRSAPPHWSRPDVELDVWDLKALLVEVAERAHGAGATLTPVSGPLPRLDASAAFEVRDASGKAVGHGGRVAAGLVDAPAWAGPVWALEIALPADVAARPSVTFQPLPQLPPVERDLALLVPDRVRAEDLSALVRRVGGVELEGLEPFDLYRGAGIPQGTRSLALRLRFRSAQRTLRDEEVDDAVRSILRRIQEELGVEVRG